MSIHEIRINLSGLLPPSLCPIPGRALISLLTCGQAQSHCAPGEWTHGGKIPMARKELELQPWGGSDLQELIQQHITHTFSCAHEIGFAGSWGDLPCSGITGSANSTDGGVRLLQKSSEEPQALQNSALRSDTGQACSRGKGPGLKALGKICWRGVCTFLTCLDSKIVNFSSLKVFRGVGWDVKSLPSQTTL